ncbi:dihydroxyacetone kinase subunit DhaK [Arthrobacter sp. 2MCAF14]|uniref:dihydroxyacetone kinase subunit DhaK n=1 Tax=Arthrobacter sp. 2MCAF14 TaxID=3232982 RepID=UPI003F913E03
MLENCPSARSPRPRCAWARTSTRLRPDEVELGVGIHGERGTARVPFAAADEPTALLVDPLVAELGLGRSAPSSKSSIRCPQTPAASGARQEVGGCVLQQAAGPDVLDKNCAALGLFTG